ncbi:MAG: fluoride efflux transporter CrcB [Thermoleophilia bacterium]|nr:fluoride efflux transporter CrcB [Thermoleophilia bacterium]
MSPLLIVAVGAIGGAGAVARLLLDGAVSVRVSTPFPVGTLAVNLLGSLVLGIVAGVGIGADGARLVTTGLLGSFTTFSTWMLESHRLAEDGEGGVAAANLAVSLIAGVALAWLGTVVGGAR